MAGRDSSSKRKSSKRKRDKASSQKKNRKKKQRRHYSSDSSYSSDKSLSSEYASKSYRKKGILKNRKISRGHSISASSSHDHQAMSSDSDSSSSGYKRKKARRLRLNLKSTKKQAKKRSARLKVDLDAHSGKKRKRLGRDHAGKPKNRSSKRKAKIYLSSDSESCSTCQSTSSRSTEDSEPKRSKMISETEVGSYNDHEKLEKRSRRSSSCERGSRQSVSAGHDDVALSPIVNNSRRLKSVITFTDRRFDDEEMENDTRDMNPHKEEMVYDQNDYSPLKSPDINEDGTNQFHGNSSKMIDIENVTGGVADPDKDDYSQLEAIDKNNIDNWKEIDASGLEMILRQKALENLKKFRGRLHTGPDSSNLKMNDDSIANISSDAMVSSDFRVTNQSSGSSQKSDLFIPKEAKRLLDSENVEKEHGITTQIAEQPNDGLVLLGCAKEGKYICSNLDQNKAVSRIDTHPGAESTNAGISLNTEPSSSSSIGPTHGDHELERENETKDGSSFEQKTMSVMRGGEMVQVSYKVYIPKKAPALARRQLKR